MSEARFVPLRYGIDDLTLGFDMTGSRSVKRLNDLPGVTYRSGKMLGHTASWGDWSHLLGRSVSFWRPETNRLYVQAKLAPEGELCPPRDLAVAVRGLMERMAIVGLTSWHEPWVTRLDVAVDASCRPADGKLLLDGLAAVRLPKGWRTTWAGTPRSTVYFRAARSETVRARAYCRNLKRREGEPFGLIRLEAVERYPPKEAPLKLVACSEFAAALWHSRFGRLASTVVRLAREVQALELADRMQRGELRYSQVERLHLFLELERLGVASGCYPPSIYASRRREARGLGFAVSDAEGDDAVLELGELLRPYLAAVEEAA